MRGRRTAGWGCLGVLALGGCGVMTGLEGEPGPPRGAGYAVQQGGGWRSDVRTAIVAALEARYPDYPDRTVEIERLVIQPDPRQEAYRFRARLRVIGIAGPSLPLYQRVAGLYDPRTGQVTWLLEEGASR